MGEAAGIWRAKMAVAMSSGKQDLKRADCYRLSVEEYSTFRAQGFLVVKGLVSADEIGELRHHTEELMQGRLPEQLRSRMSERDPRGDTGVTTQGLEAPPEHLSPEEKAQYFL